MSDPSAKCLAPTKSDTNAESLTPLKIFGTNEVNSCLTPLQKVLYPRSLAPTQIV